MTKNTFLIFGCVSISRRSLTESWSLKTPHLSSVWPDSYSIPVRDLIQQSDTAFAEHHTAESPPTPTPLTVSPTVKYPLFFFYFLYMSCLFGFTYDSTFNLTSSPTCDLTSSLTSMTTSNMTLDMCNKLQFDCLRNLIIFGPICPSCCSWRIYSISTFSGLSCWISQQFHIFVWTWVYVWECFVCVRVWVYVCWPLDGPPMGL